MKKQTLPSLCAALLLILTGCSPAQDLSSHAPAPSSTTPPPEDAVEITLQDSGVLVDGTPAGHDASAAVYTASDIVYYRSGMDFTYGEGDDADAHEAEEAADHTVVHITHPGSYRVHGSLTRGQIAVDLGENAKDDPNAVVTLILDGTDITCTVAPAVIFYRVYECGSDDVAQASKDVDTSAAGANVIIADGSVNTVNGSYVARIYDPGSVVLDEDGTEVEDAKKLHKYDGAFYSKMSLNVTGGPENTGVLTINAENEGLDSELHLTVNGGILNINSGNDGINTNEDGVSVTTVNGGTLTIRVTGETGEGDGIDSNGWLVINGGTVTAAACSESADAGIDSDLGIHINGGTVLATGHMLDRIEDGGQTHAVFSFAQTQDGARTVTLKNEADEAVLDFCPGNNYSVLIYSSPDLTSGFYTLWSGENQLAGRTGMGSGRPQMPGVPGQTPPDFPRDMEFPEGKLPPEGAELPEDRLPPEGTAFPEGTQRPDGPGRPVGGGRPTGGGFGPGWDESGRELMPDFQIAEGSNLFEGISPL